MQVNFLLLHFKCLNKCSNNAPINHIITHYMHKDQKTASCVKTNTQVYYNTLRLNLISETSQIALRRYILPNALSAVKCSAKHEMCIRRLQMIQHACQSDAKWLMTTWKQTRWRESKREREAHHLRPYKSEEVLFGAGLECTAKNTLL